MVSASISFVGAFAPGNAPAYHRNRVFVVVGSKKQALAWLDSAAPATLIGNARLEIDLAKELVSAATVSEFSGQLVTHVVREYDGETPRGLVRVSFILVPTTCSRYNCPSRPDVLDEHLPRVFKAEAAEANPANASAESSTTRVSVCIILPEGADVTFARLSLSYAAAIGRACPLYSRKSGRDNKGSLEVQAAFACSKNVGELINGFADARLLSAVAEGVRRTAELVDAPCNEVNTDAMVDAARRVVERLHAAGAASVSIEVIAGEELQVRGFGGIYGVGKAAAHPPALVILKHTPSGASKSVTWVGKGIVYDTGGLSMKDRTNMVGMKRDMGGAAAILHAFEAAVSLGFKENLSALLCLAENSVGRLATRPDDIHTLYSGKTVEINNTDAEGRLVLADGVSYAARHLAPDCILDMCTLTGAQGISTGRRHGAIVCNDETLEHLSVVAGRRSGDMVHPLLYCPELFTTEFSSTFADMKNSVKNRDNAQASCAAQFIANNLGDYSKLWLHVDMASPVHRGERATGYGVALLVQLFHLDGIF
eukprot:Opistho-2@71015